MLKYVLATMTGMLMFGGAVSTAEAPPPKPQPIVISQAVNYQVRETIPVLPIPAKARLYDPRTCLTAGLTIYQYGIDRHDWGWGPWAIKRP
jgi:hypothetical protein